MQEVLGFVRHAITTFGGAWLMKAGLEGSEVELVAGAIVTLLGVAWSVYDKRRRAA